MIIAFVSQKGGVGKTTLAVSFAWELTHRGASVLLVDADPQGSARAASEAATERGLRAPTTVALAADMGRADQLPRLARDFDHVIIDTPGRIDKTSRAALMIADVAIVPVSQSGLEVWAAGDTVELIEQARMLRPDLQSALALVRRASQTALGRRARSVVEQAPMPVLQAETTYRIAWQESISAGQGVAQYAPKDKAATELRAMVNEVLALAAGPQKAVANG